MRPHFSIGCYDDRRRTARLRQGIHFSRIQVLFADHMQQRAGVDNKFSFYAGRHLFSEGEKKAALFSHLILEYFWPASTLLHGHIALATLSLPETDPQILEHWDYADEDHLGKSFQAMDFGLECQHDAPRL